MRPNTRTVSQEKFRLTEATFARAGGYAPSCAHETAEVVVAKYIEDGEHAWFVEAVLSRCFASYAAISQLQEHEEGILLRVLDDKIHASVTLDHDCRQHGTTVLHEAGKIDLFLPTSSPFPPSQCHPPPLSSPSSSSFPTIWTAAADNEAIVRLCIRRFGTAAKDVKNRRAVDLAAPRCKALLEEASLFLGRFEILPLTPAYQSVSSTVIFCLDRLAPSDQAQVKSRAKQEHHNPNPKKNPC